jgi:MFS family permease
LLYTLGFLVGGLITVLYPLMTALSVDRLGPEKAVPVASTTLFIYCIGAIVGPTFVAWLMTALGDRMLFVHNALVHFTIIAYALWRITREGPIPHGNKSQVDTGEERLVG